MKKGRSEKTTNGIIPQRFIPFDLGMKISVVCKDRIENYLKEHEYAILPIPGMLTNVSSDVLFKIEISSKIRLYIYSYGVGVFAIEEPRYEINEKYAVDYCQYRKDAHKELLEFTHGDVSVILRTIIDDLREIVQYKATGIRTSANNSWEYSGLSYVMTVSYIIKPDKSRNDYDDFSEIEKKNLHIMLQPSLAHKEDSMTLMDIDNDEKEFDPYNFDVSKFESPKNWIKSEDCAIYISWAAVVVYLRESTSKYVEIFEYLEVDLQAMWLYTYCQYVNLKEWSSNKKLTSGQLKKEKYNFQRKYNEFISNNDSSTPVYISEIRNELINTSAIAKEKDDYAEYIEFCIDETESYESEKQRKFSVMSEILLFIIAFIQIAPMIYSVMVGGYKELEIFPVVVMVLVLVVGIVFIIRKD